MNATVRVLKSAFGGTKNNMIQRIEFDIDGENFAVAIEGPIFRGGLPHGARVVESLLMTQGLYDFRVKLWNQGVDVIESGLVVFVAAGGNMNFPAFIEMVKVQVTMLKRRVGL